MFNVVFFWTEFSGGHKSYSDKATLLLVWSHRWTGWALGHLICYSNFNESFPFCVDFYLLLPPTRLWPDLTMCPSRAPEFFVVSVLLITYPFRFLWFCWLSSFCIFCSTCCSCLRIVHFWLPNQFSLTFIVNEPHICYYWNNNRIVKQHISLLFCHSFTI